nr:CMF_HP1_G0046330.mRNA.1.CDS.1 [Saccharomyces cerevisiae]
MLKIITFKRELSQGHFLDTHFNNFELLRINTMSIFIKRINQSRIRSANINAQVNVEDPNIDLYNFEGNLELKNHRNDTIMKYPLGPDNVIYRGSILRNTQNVVGMVIFSGVRKQKSE